MSLRSSDARPQIFSAAIGALLAAVAFPSVSVGAEQGLLLTGYNASFASGMPMGQQEGISKKALCGSDGISSLQTANQTVLDRLGERLGGGGLPSLASVESGASAVRTEMCQADGNFSVEPTAITYSSCRMTMDQQSVLTDMRLPSGQVDGAMEIANLWEAEVMRVPLHASEGASTTAGAGGISWTGPGDTRQVAGYPATRWDFGYSASMSVSGMSMNVKTEGHGYFASDLPGMEIVRTFYDRFAEGTSFGQGGGSFFEGIMKTWVEVLDRGLPMEMDQTVNSSMMGMGGMGGGHRSILKVTGAQLVDLPDDFCTRAFTPDYFEVTDAGAAMSGMTVTPGGAGSGAEAEAAGPMSGLSSVFEMLKSGQQPGVATPGQQQAPSGNPGGGTPTRAPAGAAAPGRTGPSSAELMSDDVTQSVQKHLQALGYDPGNTDGELSTQTVIAISQFQAERGMEVTGEVTPQLLGILGAAVDSP